jgi:hypothetical protein
MTRSSPGYRPIATSGFVHLSPENRIWAATLDGHAAVGGVKWDVDVPVQHVLKDFSFGAMLAVDVQKARFGIGLNGLFARVSPDSKVGEVKIDVTSDRGQLTIAPYYRVLEWHYGRVVHG